MFHSWYLSQAINSLRYIVVLHSFSNKAAILHSLSWTLQHFNPYHKEKLQLLDFQKSWVCYEGRIKSLIASISHSFPIGTLITLYTGDPVEFKPSIIEGVQ